MPTWEFSYHYSNSSSKPALAHTLSKRRGQQLRSACQELADADTPSYHNGDAPYPGRSVCGEEPRCKDGYHNVEEKASAPRAFTQRTVRRKKSSLDLRDLFLSGETGSSRTASDA
ncbi:hypothetical protein BD414DRAFT_478294 [Trametes punicea]|nr:hypothetical protein BD414DRAFT_478294 [Trametes punicea]